MNWGEFEILKQFVRFAFLFTCSTFFNVTHTHTPIKNCCTHPSHCACDTIHKYCHAYRMLSSNKAQHNKADSFIFTSKFNTVWNSIVHTKEFFAEISFFFHFKKIQYSKYKNEQQNEKQMILNNKSFSKHNTTQNCFD